MADRAHEFRRAGAVRAAEHERAQRGERVRVVARSVEVHALVPDLAVIEERALLVFGSLAFRNHGRGIGFGGIYAAAQNGEHGDCGRLSGRATRETSAREHPCKENKQQTRHEEPAKALGSTQLLFLGKVLLGHLTEEAAVDGAERGLGSAGRRERYVASAACARDAVERVVFEARLHGLALVHLHARAGGVRHRTLQRVVAESDREDGNRPLLRLLRRLKCAAAQVAAVGDEDDRVVLVLRGVERAERRSDRAAEVSLAARRGMGTGILDRAADEGVVGGERTQQHARAAEGDKRTAVAVERRYQVREVGLRAFEAVRTHVLREHGARHVKRDHDVARADFRLLLRLAPLWTRRGEEDECKPSEQQDGLQAEEPRMTRQ